MSVSATIDDADRIIIKVGSALLTDEFGQIRHRWLDGLVDDVASLRNRRKEILVVSSGAIAVGRRLLDLGFGPRNRTLRLEESQAAAAAGQIRLAHAWQQSLARHDIPVAQVLLTAEDTENRRRYLNARSTIATLLRLRVVPVINENDTVTTEEIRFGDNDRLAGRVAQMIGADLCVLLSDVDGLYTADPNVDRAAEHVPEVPAISPAIEGMAGRAMSADGSGGMVTKIAAARLTTAAGCHLVIASGHDLQPLTGLENGARCTWFTANSAPQTARKRWISGGLKPAGRLLIDAGATRALSRGKSLLPAGVAAVEGVFQRGDSVRVMTEDGRELGRGLVAYSSDDADLIKGRKSAEIEALLGYRGREEMIHRDDLVLTEGGDR